jgi:hypothetical protein
LLAVVVGARVNRGLALVMKKESESGEKVVRMESLIHDNPLTVRSSRTIARILQGSSPTLSVISALGRRSRACSSPAAGGESDEAVAVASRFPARHTVGFFVVGVRGIRVTD